MIRRIFDSIAIVAFFIFLPFTVLAQVGPIQGSGSSGVTIGTTTISGGATTQVLYNLSGVVASSSGFTFDGNSVIIDNGAAAVSPLVVKDNGTAVFTIADGGDITVGSTPKWGFYTSGSNNDMQLGTGNIHFGTAYNSVDVTISREAAAVLQLGVDVNGAAVNQTLKAHDGITGTDVIGANLTLSPGVGTGAGAGAQVALGRTIAKATGTTAQTQTTGAHVCESKILSNTSATATALVNITLPNNSAGAGRATISVQCSDGTNFDSDLVTSYDSYVNKAGTLTIGTAVTTGTSAANNSGSCTVAPTWVANGTTSIDLKVTPVFTTIVPTSVVATVNFENFGGVLGGGGVVSCK